MRVSTPAWQEKESDIPIGVEDEGNVLHLAVGELLLEADAQALEACAGLLDIVDGDGDVAEAAAGVGVAVGVALEVGVGLCAVVVGELEDALACEAVLCSGGSAVVEGEEVEGEGIELVLWGESERDGDGERRRRTGDEVHAEDLQGGQWGRQWKGRDVPRCRT